MSDDHVDRQQDTSQRLSSTEGETWDDRWCGREKADGTRCKAYRVKGQSACAGHLGMGIGKDPAAYAREATKRAAQVRVDRAEAPKKKVREVLADVVEELQCEISDAYREAIRTGSDAAMQRVRAAEQLLSRVHGKPKETIEQVSTPKPKTLQELEALTPEQRLALWAELEGLTEQ